MGEFKVGQKVWHVEYDECTEYEVVQVRKDGIKAKRTSDFWNHNRILAADRVYDSEAAARRANLKKLNQDLEELSAKVEKESARLAELEGEG